jgi:hypothetical protein
MVLVDEPNTLIVFTKRIKTNKQFNHNYKKVPSAKGEYEDRREKNVNENISNDDESGDANIRDSPEQNY